MAKQGPRKKVPKELAVINADNCTGCESCLEVCPVDCINLLKIDRGIVKGTQQWCAIEMVPTENVALHVAQIGGPPEYIQANWDRLVGTAQHLAELRAGA